MDEVVKQLKAAFDAVMCARDAYRSMDETVHVELGSNLLDSMGRAIIYVGAANEAAWRVRDHKQVTMRSLYEAQQREKDGV